MPNKNRGDRQLKRLRSRSCCSRSPSDAPLASAEADLERHQLHVWAGVLDEPREIARLQSTADRPCVEHRLQRFGRQLDVDARKGKRAWCSVCNHKRAGEAIQTSNMGRIPHICYGCVSTASSTPQTVQ